LLLFTGGYLQLRRHPCPFTETCPEIENKNRGVFKGTDVGYKTGQARPGEESGKSENAPVPQKPGLGFE